MRNLIIPDIVADARGYGRGGAQKGLQEFGRGIYLRVGYGTKFGKFQYTYRDDRVAFAYDCLPQLRATFALYQEEILSYFDEGYRRVAVRGPHGLGKTLVAAILTHHLLLTTKEDAKVPTLASVWRQLDKYLWPEIHKVASLLDWQVIGRDPYTRDELMVHSIRTNGGLSEAFAVTSGDAALIEGAHASRLMYIFDESKTINASMWDAAEGAFATEDALMLGVGGVGECFWFAISTPGGADGRFWQIHSRKEGYDDWLVRHVTLDEALDAGRIGRNWVAMRGRQWGTDSAVYKRRVLGEFASGDYGNLIPLDHIEQAMQRWRDWDAIGRPRAGQGRRIMGVDVARFGGDKTAFAERVAMRLEALHVYGKQRTTVSAGHLRPFCDISQEIRIEMDSGLGASVFDMLSSDVGDPYSHNNLIPIFMGAGTSLIDESGIFRFNCVRSAAWWNMRELLDPDNEHNVMLCPSDTLTGDLAAPTYEVEYMHGFLTICVEPKEAIRKSSRLGRSTDEGDAVVIAFFDKHSHGGGKGVVV